MTSYQIVCISKAQHHQRAVKFHLEEWLLQQQPTDNSQQALIMQIYWAYRRNTFAMHVEVRFFCAFPLTSFV